MQMHAVLRIIQYVVKHRIFRLRAVFFVFCSLFPVRRAFATGII